MCKNVIGICLLLFLSISGKAQNSSVPDIEIGVFVEIFDELDLGQTNSSLDSMNISFNAYFVPSNSINVSAHHVVLEVNNGSQVIFDFSIGTDGTGIPDGLDVFEEDGTWYITTDAYSGVENYEFSCSIIYSDGTESDAVSFTGD